MTIIKYGIFSHFVWNWIFSLMDWHTVMRDYDRNSHTLHCYKKNSSHSLSKANELMCSENYAKWIVVGLEKPPKNNGLKRLHYFNLIPSINRPHPPSFPPSKINQKKTQPEQKCATGVVWAMEQNKNKNRKNQWLKFIVAEFLCDVDFVGLTGPTALSFSLCACAYGLRKK